mgnify:CR=1 FL=1
MSYIIVRLKLTTIEKVVSLMNKLKKYDIVESGESVPEHTHKFVLDEEALNYESCECGALYGIHKAGCPMYDKRMGE